MKRTIEGGKINLEEERIPTKENHSIYAYHPEKQMTWYGSGETTKFESALSHPIGVYSGMNERFFEDEKEKDYEKSGLSCPIFMFIREDKSGDLYTSRYQYLGKVPDGRPGNNICHIIKTNDDFIETGPEVTRYFLTKDRFLKKWVPGEKLDLKRKVPLPKDESVSNHLAEYYLKSSKIDTVLKDCARARIFFEMKENYSNKAFGYGHSFLIWPVSDDIASTPVHYSSFPENAVPYVDDKGNEDRHIMDLATVKFFGFLGMLRRGGEVNFVTAGDFQSMNNICETFNAPLVVLASERQIKNSKLFHGGKLLDDAKARSHIEENKEVFIAIKKRIIEEKKSYDIK